MRKDVFKDGCYKCSDVTFELDESGKKISARHLLLKENVMFDSHSHECAQVILSLSGVVIVVIERRTYVFNSGYFIWIPPNIKHQTVTNSKTELISLHIEKDMCQSFKYNPCVMEASPLLVEVSRRYNTLYNQSAPTAPNLVESIISLILIEIENSTQVAVGLPLPKDKRLLKICYYLFENPLSQKSITELLHDVPLSYRQAIRIFKEQTGLNLNMWRSFLKLNISVSLLISGLTVAQVSDKIGYSNPSSFSNAFKNKFGVSPNEYRETANDRSQLAFQVEKIA